MRSRIPAARIRPCPRPRRTRGVGARALLALTLWLLAALSFGVPAALAAPLSPLTLSASLAAARPPTTASCARLAQADPTATNGSLWGATILPGFDAPGGWFGVPVCANGVNQLAPGGANVSCDAAPAHAASGCAPGSATSDGYGWSFQCVELVARFAAWAYGDAPGAWHGDAPYLWLSGHHPNDFTAERDGVSRQPPAPGDILVWGSLDSAGRPWPSGPAGGHVAVVAAVGGGHITFVEENMLGHRGAEAINIPSETTTLTQSATGAWALGSTYGLHGGRALYGWLHSSRDAGHFPTGTVAKTGTTTATPGGASATATPTAAASALPSLAQGVIVTNGGALAELVWSDTHTPERLTATSQPSGEPPRAVVKPLGAPPGVALAPNQTPAVVTLPSGERYIFARGQDGALYSAYTPADTSSRQASVAWQALGAPPGVTLISGISALWTSQQGMLVGALGSDGAIWLCGGPAGMLGVWVSLGRPTQTSGFQSAPVLALAPSASAAASGAVGQRALAIGADGRLYEADWSAPSAASPPSIGATATTGAATATATATLAPALDAPPGWSAWSAAPLPGVASALAPHLIVASAPPGAAQAASAAGELDLLATDAVGQIWLLRGASGGASGGQRPWSATPLRLPTPTSVALAAVVQPPADASVATTLLVYAADAMSGGASGGACGGASGAPSTATPDATSTPAPAATQARVSAGAFALPPAESGAQSASGAPAPASGAWTALGTIALASPSTAASAGSASSAPTAPAIQATPTQTPTPNSAAPAASATGVSVALAMGAPNQQGKLLSALLAASGTGALLLGAPAALRSLAPGLTPSSTFAALGAAPDPAVFSDDFGGGALDPRWLLTAAPAASAPLAQVAQGVLTLSIPASPASAPSVAVAQGAPAGDFSLTVRVAPSDAAHPSHSAGLHSGIALRLDTWHAVTLTLSQPAPGAAATVALCANAAGTTPWCSASLPAPAAATQGVYLRVSQVGDAVTGFVSPDGTQWTTVGAWTLAWLPTSIAELGPYGPPLSPAATAQPGGVALPGAAAWQRYTSVGLFVSADAGSAAGKPPSARFSGFSITTPAEAAPDPTPDPTPIATSAAG